MCVCVRTHVNRHISLISTPKISKEIWEEGFCELQQKITGWHVFGCAAKHQYVITQALLLVLCLFHQHITLTGVTADILINLTLFYVELQANVDKSC